MIYHCNFLCYFWSAAEPFLLKLPCFSLFLVMVCERFVACCMYTLDSSGSFACGYLLLLKYSQSYILILNVERKKLHV